MNLVSNEMEWMLVGLSLERGVIFFEEKYYEMCSRTEVNRETEGL